jgi:hypothetical protein
VCSRAMPIYDGAKRGDNKNENIYMMGIYTTTNRRKIKHTHHTRFSSDRGAHGPHDVDARARPRGHSIKFKSMTVP